MGTYRISYDPLDESWSAVSEGEPEGALVTATLGDVSWTVSTIDHSIPFVITVASPPASWSSALLETLLGRSATETLLANMRSIDTDATDAEPHDGTVDLILDGEPVTAARRRAMGMLAIATTGPASSPLHDLDIAVLLQRLGLERQQLEQVVDINAVVDNTIDAVELLPPILLDRLLHADLSAGSPALRTARAGMADARAFLARMTGEVLIGLDVDREFERITATAGSLPGAPASDLFPTNRAELPIFRGGPADDEPRDLEVCVTDPDICGALGARATYDLRKGTVSVSIGPADGGPDLFAQLLDGDASEMIASARLERHQGASQLTFTFSVDDATPGHVNIVGDPRRPLLGLRSDRAADTAYRYREGERILRSLAVIRSMDPTRYDDAATSLGELLTERRPTGLGLPAGPLLASEVEPLPSDAIPVLITDLADELAAELAALTTPLERANASHNLRLLLGGTLIRPVHGFAGRLALVTRTAAEKMYRDDPRPEYRQQAISASNLAIEAFHSARAFDEARTEEAWLSDFEALTR